ncbi:efflux RND transporter periplasmic adaptor subunit [Sphaerotilus sp.]|uniref:efflux RND transporter periplasmic adaptor subunit n=1 Tax=Sphaerotilus sp. TaxID=2093942 RepID=UPI0034E29143
MTTVRFMPVPVDIAIGVLAIVLCVGVLPARADPGAPAVPAASSSVRGVTRCAADLGLGLALAGRVAEMRVREGQIVHAGDVLLRLDQRAEELDVERRHVQWQGTAEMTIAQARHETALAQVQAARRIYQQSQGISREELDNRELVYANAVAEIQRVKTAKEMERLDYLTAKENLDRRTLRAPKAGIVTRLIKSSGESVQAHEPALRLCDLSSIQAVINVPAQASEQLREGASVSLKVGQPPMSTQGRLTFVSPVIDSASGLREVKIDLIRQGADVRPGAPVSLELPR